VASDRDRKPDTQPRVTDEIAATGAADGSWALVYTPRGAAISANMSCLPAPHYSAQWFDPRTGSFQSLGNLPSRARHRFDPPGEPARGNDWVLMLSSSTEQTQ
jgi:hypothetical protein